MRRPFGIHYCGKDPHRYAEVFARLPHLDFLDVGWGGDVARLRQALPNTFLNIRYSPTEIVKQTPDEIRQTVRRLVQRIGKSLADGRVLHQHGSAGDGRTGDRTVGRDRDASCGVCQIGYLTSFTFLEQKFHHAIAQILDWRWRPVCPSGVGPVGRGDSCRPRGRRDRAGLEQVASRAHDRGQPPGGRASRSGCGRASPAMGGTVFRRCRPYWAENRGWVLGG